MDILLDTHILLWHLSDNPKLKKEKSKIIENPENRIFFSLISLWEIAIKTSIGKLEITQPIDSLIPEEIIVLGLKIEHIQQVKELFFNHRYPFDRMLIAQAMEENLTIMTDDAYFNKYDIKLV
ncbi:MAG: type II toxin-antitoxin system VapC family toxin [Bacteroidales bacterium]|nr:type II toxin-antitoxin system VapC family toxin [Bacteroidales bacterium]